MKNFRLFYILPAIIFFASCSKDSENELEEIGGTDPIEEVIQGDVTVEVANQEAPGSVSQVYFGGNEIPVENFNGEYVYQGDIMIPRDMVSNSPQKIVYEKGEAPSEKSVGRTSDRWPDNTVYYVIDSNLSGQSRVIDAIEHWEANTNIKFVKRSSQSNYVNFVSGSGCSSYVGMIGGRQNITLSSSCSTGNVIHEIGHAVGLWHEQSRVDRENYITIKTENIESGREHNFHTYKSQGMDGAEFTSSLDFGSIMMYGSYSFSKNGAPTMTKKDGSTFNTQRRELSSGDLTGINNMYPASSGGSEEVPEVYENGQLYYISGATVLRHRDRWYFSTKYGWKSVYLKENGYWYYL